MLFTEHLRNISTCVFKLESMHLWEFLSASVTVNQVSCTIAIPGIIRSLSQSYQSVPYICWSCYRWRAVTAVHSAAVKSLHHVCMCHGWLRGSALVLLTTTWHLENSLISGNKRAFPISRGILINDLLFAPKQSGTMSSRSSHLSPSNLIILSSVPQSSPGKSNERLEVFIFCRSTQKLVDWACLLSHH